MKYTYFAILFSFLVAMSSPVHAAQGGENELAGYLELALQENKTLQAARANLTGAEQRVRQAGTLPDPQLSVQYYLEPVETRTGPQEAAIGISQSLPWFGKLPLQKELRRQELRMEEAQLEALRLKIVRQVKEGYIEIGFWGQAQRITQENLELGRYLEGVARTQYATGAVSYSHLIKIQIELSRLQEKAAALSEQELPLQSRFSSLLGQRTDTTLPTALLLPEITIDLERDVLEGYVLETNPRIQEARQAISLARTGFRLAERDFFPDLTVSLKTILTGSAEFGEPPDSGDDPVIAGLTFNLPLFRDRRHGAVAEKGAAIRAAENNNHQQQLSLKADFAQWMYRYKDAARRIELYDIDLVPKVEQEMEVSLQAFQNGTYSILELIDTQEKLLNFTLTGMRARADLAIAVANLEEMSGMTLAHWSGPHGDRSKIIK